MDNCPICMRAATAPYRVYNASGLVVHGCVSDYHTGHLVTPSESARWHARPEAKRVRAALKRGQLGRGYAP